MSQTLPLDGLPPVSTKFLVLRKKILFINSNNLIILFIYIYLFRPL